MPMPLEIMAAEGARDAGGVIHCFSGDCRERAGLPRSRLLHLLQRHRHLQDRRFPARRRPHRPSRPPPGRDRRALPHPGALPRPPQRARPGRPHRRRARGSSRRAVGSSSRRIPGGTRSGCFDCRAGCEACEASRVRSIIGGRGCRPVTLPASRRLPPMRAQLPQHVPHLVLRARFGEDRLRR